MRVNWVLNLCDVMYVCDAAEDKGRALVPLNFLSFHPSSRVLLCIFRENKELRKSPTEENKEKTAFAMQAYMHWNASDSISVKRTSDIIISAEMKCVTRGLSQRGRVRPWTLRGMGSYIGKNFISVHLNTLFNLLNKKTVVSIHRWRKLLFYEFRNIFHSKPPNF